MAESATGKSTSNNWWKSLTVRKKPKEISVYSTAEGTEERSWTVSSGSVSSSSGARENQHPNSMPSGVTEHSSEGKTDKSNGANTGRRNLKISRSGRFKEKRKVRATLPDSSKFFQENPSSHTNERQ